jgi:hypothetical protein
MIRLPFFTVVYTFVHCIIVVFVFSFLFTPYVYHAYLATL